MTKKNETGSPDISDRTRSTSVSEQRGFTGKPTGAALLLAYAPSISAVESDRFSIESRVVVGREGPSNITIDDSRLSRAHFSIVKTGEGRFEIADLSSRNGTYLNGHPVTHAVEIKDATVIRAGRAVFVFHENPGDLLAPTPVDTFGMAGRFHLHGLIHRLKKLADSCSHALINGPTGVGKELAAEAFARLTGRKLRVYNCAAYGTEDEAATTLFGVRGNVYTNIPERTGLIEAADGGVLFLDEAHHLPPRLQKGLLRVVERWTVVKVGEIQEKKVDVRFVLTSNEDESSTYGLAHDLVARMTVITIPSLRQRTSDIPYLFRALLHDRLQQKGLDSESFLNLLAADHYESLCIDGFPFDNTRGLIKLADSIVSEAIFGASPEQAVSMVFESRYLDGPVIQRKLAHRHGGAAVSPDMEPRAENPLNQMNIDLQTIDLIKNAYYQFHGVVIDMQHYLTEEKGLKISRRRIAKILDGLGLPRLTRSR